MGSMIQASQLIYLKLKATRQKDRADVVELIKAGIDTTACKAYLRAHAPDLVAMFDSLIAQAAAEE